MRTSEHVVDGIPVLLVVPDRDERQPPVLWMSHLGGSAEQTRPMLERFAAAGHPAVSFDAVLHGRRGSEDPWELAAAVLATFRRRMWPILGQTTLEAMRVLTWTQELLGDTGSVLAGGVSMRGDIAVALAGIDDRVVRVATVGSTPDWSRPGMHELGHSAKLVDQGVPDRYAEWFAAHLDPMRHLQRYRRDVAIGFELGADDQHVPADNARSFRDALVTSDPAAAVRVRVQTHPGLDHLGVTSSEPPLDAAAAWLLNIPTTSQP